ncbi:MAG: alpha-glucan family phosphorylase [Methanomicrobiaceae archaeon]|nr:alpha-glucan family phosphorylase [Methanomicrobiaceae archaeon]
MDSIHRNFAHVPERISGLVDLAYNLWWSWHPEARVLFKELDRQVWKECLHNPVQLLQMIPQEYLEQAVNNPQYLHRYDIITFLFKRYMESLDGWFGEQFPKRRLLTIAYFSAEYGLHHSLPFYAGGLGFLAGDHLKECSDLHIPMVAVGFMYSQGYLHQDVQTDGWQEAIRIMLDRDASPVTRVKNAHGEQMVVQVPFIDPPIHVAVWKVQVGRIPLYLLDTDIEENAPENRGVSSRLYTSDHEVRLQQEIVLGIGGRKVLKDLGIEYSAVHLNEGHPAFALLERVRERVERGMDFAQAVEQVRGTTVFTTHTPVPAGHDVFSAELVDRYFSSYYPRLGIDREAFLALGAHPDNHGFNMTALAFRMSAFHNAVSKNHAEVTRETLHWLWPDMEKAPLDAITNGVHLPTWMNPRVRRLISKYMQQACPHWKEEHDNPVLWELVDDIPDSELWDVHNWLKAKLINRIRERQRRKWAVRQDEPLNLVAEGVMLNPSTLTIGFARRFSTYKRADLIFHDIERLKRIVNNRWRPVQIIFAGKAHPDDYEGKLILQRIYRHAQEPEFGGRIAFVEDYGEQTAQYLVHGVDVWLNNPLPPLEACGTSGMKAAMNGVLNMSIADGWWPEGYNGKNGWIFGEDTPPDGRDAADASAIYELLEKEIVPLYYSVSMDGIPHGWVKMMKEAIKSVAPRFSARRMVKEYVRNYYPSMLICAESDYEVCELK